MTHSSIVSAPGEVFFKYKEDSGLCLWNQPAEKSADRLGALFKVPEGGGTPLTTLLKLTFYSDVEQLALLLPTR